MSDKRKILREGSIGWPSVALDDFIAMLEGMRDGLSDDEKRSVEIDIYYTNSDDGVHVDLDYVPSLPSPKTQ